LISYGTGTPVSRGFDQYEIIEIINQVIRTNKVVCIELVEVNPLLDTKGNKMAETAFQVLEAITETIVLPIEV
jgi:arginase